MVTKRLPLKSKIIKNLVIIYSFGILSVLLVLSIIVYFYSRNKQNLLQAFSEIWIISTSFSMLNYYLQGIFPFFIEFSYEIYLDFLFGEFRKLLYIYFGILALGFELVRFYSAKRLCKVKQTRNTYALFVISWIVVSALGSFYWIHFAYFWMAARKLEFGLMIFFVVAWNLMLSYITIQAQTYSKLILFGSLTFFFFQITTFGLVQNAHDDIFFITLLIIMTALELGLIVIYLVSKATKPQEPLNTNPT